MNRPRAQSTQPVTSPGHRAQRSMHGSAEEGHPRMIGVGETDRHERVFPGAQVWGERTLLPEAALVLDDPASLWHGPVPVIGGHPGVSRAVLCIVTSPWHLHGAPSYPHREVLRGG